MTGIRQSFVFALEDEFGKGKPNNNKWIAPPVGSFFNNTHSRQATKIYTVGSKFFDTVAYGQLNGAFNWTFVFDYNYLEPLQLAFEKIGCTQNSDGVHYTHTFEKVNNMRIPSFTVRRKILNKMAGGPEDSDEITELRGCVVRNVTFSKAAGTSQLQVTFTGFYVDERMYKGELDATDYKEYEGKLSEYMCMFIGAVSTDNYVANTESLEFSLENNSDAIYNTCSPFAGLYYEGRTNVTFGTTCYSNNPSYYKQRVYSGGFRNDVLMPMAKGLKPIPLVTLAAYDKSIRDPEYADITDYNAAMADSDESMMVELEQVVIKSLTWPKGNDQKLQDTISSAECKKIKLTIVNTINDTVVDNTNVDMAYNTNNVVTSYGYGLIFHDPENHRFYNATTNKAIPNALITKTQGTGETATQVAPEMPDFSIYNTTGGTTFVGWFTAPAGQSSSSLAGYEIEETNQITSNMDLYARWTHTVTFNPNSGTILNINGGYTEYSGYTAFTQVDQYVGYYVDHDGTKTLVTNDNKSTLGITAGETKAYTKGVRTTENLTLVTNSDTLLLTTSSVNELAPASSTPGYKFVGWYTEATDGKMYSNTTIRADMTLYAHYGPEEYTLSFVPGDGATVSPTSKPITYNKAYGTLPTPTKEGYTFVGWYTAAEGGTAVTADTVASVGNVTVYAHWTQNSS